MLEDTVSVLSLHALHCSNYTARHLGQGHLLAQHGLMKLRMPPPARDPRWPEPEFPAKMPEKYPLARNSGTPRKSPKIPETCPQRPFLVFRGYFSGISGSFGGISGDPECRVGGYLFGIFRGNSGSDHVGSLWQTGALLMTKHNMIDFFFWVWSSDMNGVPAWAPCAPRCCPCPSHRSWVSWPYCRQCGVER